jgi:hypothetical protein
LACFGCGADHYDRLSGSEAGAESPLDANERGDVPRGEVAGRDPVSAGEGLLEVTTRSAVTSFLGASHCVVEDQDGEVVAGADEESSAAGSDESQLSFTLRAGSAYTLRLTATTDDARPTTCHATVGPVAIDAGAIARVRVFAWDCGDRMGYVPQTAHADCYWLAGWSFVGDASAALGDAIDVGVVASASADQKLRYRWATTSEKLGSFSDPSSPSTAFRCQSRGELPLEVAISDGVCEQRVTQAISCR